MLGLVVVLKFEDSIHDIFFMLRSNFGENKKFFKMILNASRMFVDMFRDVSGYVFDDFGARCVRVSRADARLTVYRSPYIYA